MRISRRSVSEARASVNPPDGRPAAGPPCCLGASLAGGPAGRRTYSHPGPGGSPASTVVPW